MLTDGYYLIYLIKLKMKRFWKVGSILYFLNPIQFIFKECRALYYLLKSF
jgi:hypothetical protein